MFKEFREFALRGNVVDLAVGFVLGGAFSTIVTSLVNDVLTPPLGLLIGDVDFSELSVTLRAADATLGREAVTLRYGDFISAVVSFLIVAFALFFLVKATNRLKRPAAEASPPRQEVLLTEIRDALRAQGGSGPSA